MRLKSGLLGLFALAAISGTAHANLLSNGSFEDLGGGSLSPGAWGLFDSIPSWTSDPQYRDIEVQAGTIIPAQDGLNYIELESDPGNSSYSVVSQTFTVTSAGDYLLSFFYAPRTDQEGDNLVNASIDGNLLASPSGTRPPQGWTLMTALITLGVGSHVLSFDAFGSFDNTLGGFVDNVDISAVPLPPGLILLGTGVAGIGYMGRRRRQKATA